MQSWYPCLLSLNTSSEAVADLLVERVGYGIVIVGCSEFPVIAEGSMLSSSQKIHK